MGLVPDEKRHGFAALDALRGVAAIGVMMFHYGVYAQRPWMANGFLAVDFFFLLSGFVIAHAYGVQPRWWPFLRRRIIRLYPLFVLVMTGSLVAALAQQMGLTTNLAHYLLGLLMLPSPRALLADPPDPILWVFPLSPPSWSLSLELWVNVMYAFFGVWMMRWKRLWLPVAAGVLIYTAYYYPTVDMGSNGPTYAGGWARVAWSFFAGVALQQLYAAKARQEVPAGMTLIGGLFLMEIFLVPWEYRSLRLAAILLLFPLIVWVMAHVRLTGIARRAAIWLGEISYPLYLIHLPLYPFLFPRIGTWLGIWPRLGWQVMLVGVITVLLAWGLFLIYDRPVRRWLTRRWR